MVWIQAHRAGKRCGRVQFRRSIIHISWLSEGGGVFGLVNRRDRLVETYELVVNSQETVSDDFLKGHLYNTYIKITCAFKASESRAPTLSCSLGWFCAQLDTGAQKLFSGSVFTPSPLFSINSVNFFAGLTLSEILFFFFFLSQIGFQACLRLYFLGFISSRKSDFAPSIAQIKVPGFKHLLQWAMGNPVSLLDVSKT